MSAAKGVTLIRGKEPLLKTLAFAVEYDTGELYFDRSGRVVRRLAELNNGWLREPRAAPGKTVVTNPEFELVLEFGVSGAGVSLSLDSHPRGIEPTAATAFPALVDTAIRAVFDELDILSLQRIGYREQYYFACKSLEESEEWLRGLGLFTVSPTIYESFGSEHYALNCTVIVVGEECRYKISVAGGERPGIIPAGAADTTVRESRAQHLGKHELIKLLKIDRLRQLHPEYFVMLDIDAFLWDELDTNFEFTEFIVARAKTNLDLFRSCVPKTPKKS
jgi:hypothetical protein